MTKYYKSDKNEACHVLKKIEPGQIVAAKFHDGNCYRGQVIEKIDDEKYKIFFCDFGDTDVIEGKNIFELSTEFLSLRWQAQETLLHGVKAK